MKFQRVLWHLLEGGKTGWNGYSTFQGTYSMYFVMMLTFKMPVDGYTGAAYEGVGFLPWLEKINIYSEPLFDSNQQKL